MLEPDDVTAIDARIEGMARAATAGTLRFQAMSLRSLGELLAAQAKMLDDQADAIESGEIDPPSMPMRLQVVPVDGTKADEPEPEPAVVVKLKEAGLGSSKILLPMDDDVFSTEMAGFLGMFDDRLRMSPFFVTAVNEAAGMPISEHMAGLVRDRVYEIRDGGSGGDHAAT